MKKLFLFLLLLPLSILGQCDLSIIDVNLDTYEVSVYVNNSEGCPLSTIGGIPDAITMIQIGYHLPNPINPDNAIVDLLTLPDAPCSPGWAANGYNLGMSSESCHPGWWFSPSLLGYIGFYDNDQLPAYTGDTIIVPLNPSNLDYVTIPNPTAECGDDLIDYWLSEGECIEFVIWHMNTNHTWYEDEGGWTPGCYTDSVSGELITPPFAGAYPDPTCDNSWYTCNDVNPGAAVANPDFCEVVLDECNDPIACNYNNQWFEPGGFCIYCNTPGGEELCNEYQDSEGYWDFYFNAFDCSEETECDTVYIELPPDTIYEIDTLLITVTEIDTIYIELPSDTITIIETDTLYIELPPDTITITETEFIFITDTIIETEYIYSVDTIYIVQSDTVTIYEFVEIDCETGLPCSEVRRECDIYIPNAFTPDNDGYNDGWEIVLDPECWTDVKVQVISRWGNIVWESYDVNNLIWNGDFRGGDYYVQNEMYLWWLQARKAGTTEIKDLRGHVTILR